MMDLLVFKFEEFEVNKDSKGKRTLLKGLCLALPGIAIFVILPSTVFW